MGQETATAIFVAIMTVGFLMWLWSLQKALAMGRDTAESDWRTLPEERPAQTNTESGSRIVRGDPEALSQSLARAMLQLGAGGFAPLYEITERTAKRIALKKTGPLVCNQPAGMYFSEAEIRFQYLGNRITEISYILGFDRLQKKVRKVALWIILGIGLPVMLIVGGVIFFFVLPSQEPAIRGQVFQALQIAHALWPPFLVMGLHYSGRRHAKTFFSNLISTLELADRTPNQGNGIGETSITLPKP